MCTASEVIRNIDQAPGTETVRREVEVRWLQEIRNEDSITLDAMQHHPDLKSRHVKPRARASPDVVPLLFLPSPHQRSSSLECPIKTVFLPSIRYQSPRRDFSVSTLQSLFRRIRYCLSKDRARMRGIG